MALKKQGAYEEAIEQLCLITTQDQKYHRLAYPADGDTLPQKLKVDGSQIIINDFTGNKITLLDPTQSTDGMKYLNLPSPVNGSVTASFAVDNNKNVWYTNWLFQHGGVLVKFDQEGYRKSIANANDASMPQLDFFKVFALPPDLLTPNGITVSDDGMVWLADTSRSAIFSFDPTTEVYTPYVTSDPKLSSYGNATGIIKSLISRPYWIKIAPDGQLVFNEQNANNISVFDPKSESLVEYLVPSKNPAWADCEPDSDCGVAQVFDFAIIKNKIWFTEWVENNIGVVDMSVPLPFAIDLESKDISLKAGETKNTSFMITSQKDVSGLSLILSDPNDFLDETSSVTTFNLTSNSPKSVDVTISASPDAVPGTYKVLLGAQIEDVSISKFVTVTILP